MAYTCKDNCPIFLFKNIDLMIFLKDLPNIRKILQNSKNPVYSPIFRKYATVINLSSMKFIPDIFLEIIH
jgi:hypothetical protein